MPKQKKSLKKTTLNEFFKDYDSQSLSALVTSLNNSLAWELLKSFMRLRQRQFETASLDLVSKGHTHPAAHASGYALACEEMADKFIQELYDIIQGKTGVVEDPIPQDNDTDVN